MHRAPLFVVLASLLAGGLSATDTQGTSLVTVDVAVERPSTTVDPAHVVPWQSVEGLTARDFAVFSDGKACEIETFSLARRPLSLVVLIDVSAGTEVTVGSLLEPLQVGLVPALTAGDRVAFGHFGGIPLNVDRRFSARTDELKEAARAVLTADKAAPLGLNGGFGLGASPAWDAVVEAAGMLESEPGRRAILLVTDGRSTGNVHGLEDAIRHAIAAEASVFVVGEGVDEEIRQSEKATAIVHPGALLESMAGATGGAYAAVFGPEKSRPKRTDALAMKSYRFREGNEPRKPATVDEAAFGKWVGRMLATFVGDLHAGYTLGFRAPTLDGQLHALDVRVRAPGLKVRVRQRYLASRGDSMLGPAISFPPARSGW